MEGLSVFWAQDVVASHALNMAQGHVSQAAKAIKYYLVCWAGAEIKLSRPLEGKNPVVIGRLGRQPGVPTVTFYGHYDVQVTTCMEKLLGSIMMCLNAICCT